MLLSELRDVYFEEPASAQKVLAVLRAKQTAQELPEVAEVCYLQTECFCLYAYPCASVA